MRAKTTSAGFAGSRNHSMPALEQIVIDMISMQVCQKSCLYHIAEGLYRRRPAIKVEIGLVSCRHGFRHDEIWSVALQ